MDKSHGWDQLSRKMNETCAESITFSLKLKPKSMINEGVFSEDWRKSNVNPIHKKNKKFSLKVIDL